MPLPKSPHVEAKRAVLDVLRTDPVLRANRIAFVTREGGQKLCWPPEKGKGPAVLVEIDPSTWRWETEGTHDAPLTLAFTIAVGPFEEDLILDLWNAILMAIFPTVSNPAAHDRVQAILSKTQITQITAIQSPGVKSNGDFLEGTGKLEITIYLSTGE